ncbi:AAA family ATPase [Pyrobaculum neutrophilum]|uniref:ATPase n=1 Tax=Pyrobaculum neutrophilum (strain DSM 2338 / JCM 9278 / NBRC 100436 / V24Sta) TaxID=444157 RepID=B1YBZ7_PYRNV|nr:ATP-binding protein [Pyrobaculum neutrophilum]ACB39381.1 ATPase [Pyrobaculum neutrophilum V24Sta]
MLFREGPVERPDELFDREAELEELRRALGERRVVALLGVRRVGKTSLARAATWDLPRVYVDVREFEWRTYVTWDDFYGVLRSALPRSRRLLEALSKISGVSVAGLEISFAVGRGRPPPAELLKALDRWAESEGARIVFVIDEAQELHKLKGGSFAPLLAWAYDNLSNVVFLLTGSKVGLIHRLLRPEDPQSPMYGRYIYTIHVGPLPRDRAREFLARGLEEAGVRYAEEALEVAVDKLGGVIGWLAYLGLEAVKAGGLTETLVAEALEKAARLAWGEFCRFVQLRQSRRYIYIMQAAAEGAAWSEIKRYLEIREGPLYDAELSRLLKTLVEEGWLEKNDVYRPADPLLRHAAKTAASCR